MLFVFSTAILLNGCGVKYTPKIYGDIANNYNAKGGEEFFGKALLEEATVLNKFRVQIFEKAVFVWNKNNGTVEVFPFGGNAIKLDYRNLYGKISDYYKSQNGIKRYGKPTSIEEFDVHGLARIRTFEKGILFWENTNEIVEILLTPEK